jgi:hypothetical protein
MVTLAQIADRLDVDPATVSVQCGVDGNVSVTGFTARSQVPIVAALATGTLAPVVAAQGLTVSGRTFDLSPDAVAAWAHSLVALLAAQAPDATPIEAVIGPVRDIDGAAVTGYTVATYRALLMQHILPRVAQIRAGQF